MLKLRTMNKKQLAVLGGTIVLAGGIITAGVIQLLAVRNSVASEADINLMSSDTSFNESEAGAWKVEKSAKWVGDGEAEVTIDVETVKKVSDAKKDIIFAVDVSGSMMGNKLTQMKADMSELVNDLLDDGENQIALVSFESEANLEFGFTNDKSLALGAIEGLTTGNNTNYYDALKKAEMALEGYTEDENRELYLLILTDGLPTVDTPNEVNEYRALKNAYPYLTVGAIQYEMGSESVYAPVTRISDEQFVADMQTLHNTLYDVVAFPYTYTTFTVTDLINDEHFSTDGVEVSASLGEVSVEGETVTWTMGDKLRTGATAQLKAKIKLKDEYMRTAGTYATNKGESAESELAEVGRERKSSTETPTLKNNYSVIYEGNTPGDCTVNGLPDTETHFVFEAVEISATVPTCEGYNFGGFEIATEDVWRFNEDYFRMPVGDVTLKATWTKTDIEKTMEGTIYVSAKLYDEIAKKTKGVDSSLNFANAPSTSNGQGVNTVTATKDDEYPVYYFRGNVTDNNVLFANYCWKAVRTTSTGGVKLIYNGAPNASGQCMNTTASAYGVTDIGSSAFNSNYNSPAYNGYMYGTSYAYKSKNLGSSETVLSSSSLGTSYWYANSAVYGTPTASKWNLVDAYQVGSSADYPNLVGKYTFRNAEQAYTYNSVQFITAVNNSTYYYIQLSGNTTLVAQNWTYTYGDSYTDNGNGTYTINNATTINRSDRYANYNNIKGKYVCKNATNDTCSSVWYVTSDTNATTLSYIYATNKYKYAKSFSYANGTYTLDSATTVEIWNTSDANERTKLNNAHYTCFNATGQCSTLYYIYYFYGSMTPYYIELKNGKSVEDALSEMQTNTTNSTIKTKLDAWYEANLKDTDDESFLEDTVFCNDRSMATNTNGWVADGGSVSEYMYYGAYQRNYTTKKPSLNCSNSNDAFTVSADKGNGALTYPIGLLTEDELTLGGAGTSGYSNGYLYTSRGSWSLSPDYFGDGGAYGFRWRSDSFNNSVYNAHAVRPVVSIAPGTAISAGDGSKEYPWELEH